MPSLREIYTRLTVPSTEPIRYQDLLIAQEGVIPVSAEGSGVVPHFLEGWTNRGGVYQPAGLWKDSEGIVHLQGVLTNAAAKSIGSVMFNLPSGYRPTSRQTFIAIGSGSIRQVDVDPSTGAVTIEIATGAGVFLSVCGISWRTT